MINAVAGFLNRFVQLDRIKGKVSKFWYRYLNNLIKDRADVCFLNYGYAPLNDERISLKDKDETNRIYIQLYHSVASAIDLSGLDVVEMSCGRGGGAKYVKQYLKPKTMIGIDRAENAIAFCKKCHVEEGLSFACGDAQIMPLADACCDVLLNVEASHDYPDINLFLSEVVRVLRPGGRFLYTDFRKQQQCAAWREQLVQTGLELVEEEDISANVARGLELNTERSKALIRDLTPALLSPVFAQFAGTEGSLIHQSLRSGKTTYRRFVLRKKA